MHTPSVQENPETSAELPNAFDLHQLDQFSLASTPTSGGEATPLSLHVEDLELLHTYHTSTCSSMCTDELFQDLIRSTLPEIGLTHHFVLHGILAISALHLAHFRTQKAQYYHAQARRHYDTGLQCATVQLLSINDENCHALYLFNLLSSFIAFGWGPTQGDFLLFGERRLGDWAMMNRGTRAIFESKGHVLRQGVLAPFFQNSTCSLQSSALPSADSGRLIGLRQLFETTLQDDENLSTCIVALDHLLVHFGAETGSSIAPRKLLQFHEIASWLYHLTDNFLNCLQMKHPAALALFAYYCVLLNSLPNLWWIKGWVDHLIRGIYDHLDYEYRTWIRWPVAQIGWIPD